MPPKKKICFDDSSDDPNDPDYCMDYDTCIKIQNSAYSNPTQTTISSNSLSNYQSRNPYLQKRENPPRKARKQRKVFDDDFNSDDDDIIFLGSSKDYKKSVIPHVYISKKPLPPSIAASLSKPATYVPPPILKNQYGVPLTTRYGYNRDLSMPFGRALTTEDLEIIDVHEMMRRKLFRQSGAQRRNWITYMHSDPNTMPEPGTLHPYQLLHGPVTDEEFQRLDPELRKVLWWNGYRFYQQKPDGSYTVAMMKPADKEDDSDYYKNWFNMDHSRQLTFTSTDDEDDQVAILFNQAPKNFTYE